MYEILLNLLHKTAVFQDNFFRFQQIACKKFLEKFTSVQKIVKEKNIKDKKST